MKKRSNYNTIKFIYLITRVKYVYKDFFYSHNLNDFSILILFFFVYFKNNITQYRIAKLTRTSPQRVNSAISSLKNHGYIKKDLNSKFIITFKGKRTAIELQKHFKSYEDEIVNSIGSIDEFNNILTLIFEKEIKEDLKCVN